VGKVVKRLGGLVGLIIVTAACSSAPAAATVLPTRPPVVYIPTASSTPVPPTPSPTPSQTPEPTTFVCNEAAGQVLETTYPGAILPGEIPVRVYLPPCYDRIAGSFPSVILLHGKPFTESHWEDLGAVEVADRGIGGGTWPAFIMIMPLQPEPLFSQTDGGPGSYEAELMQGLLPFVEGSYRTIRGAEDRAIAGISRGGVWALEIGFRYPEVFGAVVALSPALAVNYARPAYDPLEIARTDTATLPGRIFLGAGDVDWARPKTVALADVLEGRGGAPDLVIVSGDHVSATWQALMPDMFGYLAAAWEAPTP
jgi:enterochelin esterase-like enzyme